MKQTPYYFFRLIMLTLVMAFPLCAQGKEIPIPNKTSIQAIVFDLGGVVVEADQNEASRFIASTFDLNEKEANEALIKFKAYWIGGGTEKEFWETFALEEGKILPKDWLKQLHVVLLHSIKAIPGTIEIIRELKNQGFIVALLSNATKDQAEHIKNLGYYDLFKPALISCEIGYDKPDSRAFEILLKELNLPAHVCLFIDDKLENVESAKDLGIDSIQFFDPQQLKEELAKRHIFISQYKLNGVE